NPADVKLALAHQRLEWNAALDGGDRAAVLGRDVDHIVDQAATAGAGHVLHHDAWVAGQMLAEMATNETGIGVVRTAGTGADIEVDVLAAEILRGGGRDDGSDESKCNDRDAAVEFHRCHILCCRPRERGDPVFQSAACDAGHMASARVYWVP